MLAGRPGSAVGKPVLSRSKLTDVCTYAMNPLEGAYALVATSRHMRAHGRARNCRALGYFRAFFLLYMFYFALTFRHAARAISVMIDLSEDDTRWDVTWARHRTILFTIFWFTHKIRNVAVYFCVSTRHVLILNTIMYHALTCPDVFYDERFDLLFEVPRRCFSHKCLKRYGASHYIYAEFVLRTFDAVTATTIMTAKPTSRGKVAVLVEPRQHPLVEYVVKQVMLTLGSTWSLQIFVSSTNEEFVRNSLRVYPNETGRNIVLTSLRDFGLDDLSKYGNRVQSALSAHEGLYESILGEHILWFQVDVIMRRPPKESWLRYAYVGAEWRGCEYPRCSKDVCQNICGGGNSGLSLRRRSILLRVATRGMLPEYIWGMEPNVTHEFFGGLNFARADAHFVNDDLHDNSKTRWFQDDLQLAYKLSRLQLLPPADVPPRFAVAQALPTEGLRTTNPSGLHKPWDTPWIPPVIVMRLLAQPFVRTLSRSVGMD